MNSFEDELVKIGNELTEEYLSDETIKEMVTEDPEFLDRLIEKDVHENLLMRRGDLEFLYTCFHDKKPKVIYTEIPVDYEKIKNQNEVATVLLPNLSKKITELGLNINEYDYTFHEKPEETPILELYVGRERGSMDIKIEYKHHITYDITGTHKLLISYPLGFEKYVEKIAECLGTKLEPLSIGSKP